MMMVSMYNDRFASPQQCVHGSWWVVSVLLLGTTIFSMIYFLENEARLDPNYNDDCGPNEEGADTQVCDKFSVLAFMGSMLFLLFWLPLTCFTLVFYYWPAISNADLSALAASYRTSTARANLSLMLLGMVLLAMTGFSFGVTLGVKVHEEWAFWAYAYISLIIGGASGILVVLSASFYLGSVLVMQFLICSGTPEEEIRRKYMFGVGLDRAPELESDSGVGELSHDATAAELRHERRRLRDERHRLNTFSRDLHAREALVEKREAELTCVEKKLARRKHDLEEGEKAISTRDMTAVIT